MDSLQIFNNVEFGSIRTLEINGEPWFVGKDIAEALGYEDTAKALKRHVDDDDKRLVKVGEIPTLKVSNFGAYIINESGMYALIFGSKLESAKRFKHWVTSEVLPSIRKTGSYNQNFYRVKDTSLGDIAKFVREMDRVMRDQNCHPSDIAEAFKDVCGQFGIGLPECFIKEPTIQEPTYYDEKYRFYTMEELGIASKD